MVLLVISFDHTFVSSFMVAWAKNLKAGLLMEVSIITLLQVGPGHTGLAWSETMSVMVLS